MERSSQPRNEQELVTRCVEQLVRRLPEGWSASCRREASVGGLVVDLLLEIVSPDGKTAAFVVDAKRSALPKQVNNGVAQLKRCLESEDGTAEPLFASGYVSPWTRTLLQAQDVGWVDTTGNIRMSAKSPGLFIEASGAQRDPWPDDRPLKSLGGRGAARAIRALIDFAPPYGVRELANMSGTSPATLSRVIEMLDGEGVLTRSAQRGVASVDWAALIRRWSADLLAGERAQFESSTFLEPRGIDAVIEKARRSQLRYSITGSYAASRFAPVAPTRQIAIYVDDPTAFAAELDLRPLPDRGNVRLVNAYDPLVFDRVIIDEGVTIAALGQVAVDLLGGPGREPAEGEALIEWMEGSEDVWRRGS